MGSGGTVSSVKEPIGSDLQETVAGVAQYVSTAFQNVKDAVVGEVRTLYVHYATDRVGIFRILTAGSVSAHPAPSENEIDWILFPATST